MTRTKNTKKNKKEENDEAIILKHLIDDNIQLHKEFNELATKNLELIIENERLQRLLIDFK